MNPTFDEVSPKLKFISGKNPHLTRRFCRVDLATIQILRWYQSLVKIHWPICY